IRVEEFLAAMDYRFAPPEQETLAIRTAAGPSPFAPAGTQLLQVAVQAGPAAPRDFQPQHVVLALDVSASMRHGGRWELVRRAALRWMRELRPLDELSIIVFRSEAEIIVSGAKAADADIVRQRLAEVQPTG